MKIARARVVPFALPLRAPLATARGAIAERRGALLVLVADDGRTGLGEATPIAGFGLESPARAREALAALARRVLGADPREAAALLDAAEREAPDAACARAALDGALHDLAAQAAGRSLAALLAGAEGRAPRPRVAAHALLPAATAAGAAAEAARAVAAGFRTLKLKVGAAPLADDAARVAAVRAAAGPGVALRLDANGAWPDAPTALRAIAALSRFGVEWIEQPVPAADVAALAAVRAAGLVAVAADEAVVDAAALERVLAAGAADVVVLKPSALGGLQAARRAAARARDAGCRVCVTSLLDGAVARTAALALAAALPDPLPACGLATGALLADDLATAERIADGCLATPIGDGLGAALDPAALARLGEGRGRVIARLAEAAA
jgi:o-succinylbenzoate synthase